VLFGWLPTAELPSNSPGITLYLQIVAFGLSGAFLLRWGKDEAACWLGLAYLLIGSAYAYLPAKASPFTEWMWLLPLDLFLPLVIWQFARTFPKRELGSRSRLLFRLGSALFLLLALALLMCNWLPEPLDPQRLFHRIDGPFYAYGVYLSVPLALSGVTVEFSAAAAGQRDKARLLLLVLSIVTIVLLLYVVLYFVPAYRTFFDSGSGRVISVAVLHSFVISVPLVTAYVLAMSQTLRLKVLFTLFVRYRIARLSSGVLLALPILVIAGLLWSSRSLSLSELAVSSRGAMLVFFALAGFIAYLLRATITQRIESTFFRESYDPAERTANLGRLLPQANTPSALAAIINRELSATIHLESSGVLIKRDEAWEDVEGVINALPLDAAFIWNLGDEPASPDALIDESDSVASDWLAETRVTMLTPINTASGKLVGVIASGEKQSGLAYTSQDKDFLGISARLLLPHLQRVLGADLFGIVDDEPRCAMCASCAEIWRVYSDECDSCGGAMLTLAVPKRISGKYEIQRSIGHGGSGLALLAQDVFLERHLVLKTLPNIHPDGIKALQLEARSMASIDHPNIATIYDLEVWRGLPILVMEHLAGGTLANRIQSGPASFREVLETAEVLLVACQYLHGKGVVHGDIKPSNIGYDSRTVPKLFDFGLTRKVSDVVESCLSGTPLYLSPDLLAGAPLDERSDLWALSITLYEMALGQNPIPQDSLQSTLRFLRLEEIPPLSSCRPETPASLDAFLSASLSRDRADRPSSAEAALALLRSDSV